MAETHTCVKEETVVRKRLYLVPQALAATVVASFNLFLGQMMTYSGIIVPQMMEEQNTTGSNAIPITESDSAWIASGPFFFCLATSLLCGIFIDVVGRLKAILLSSIPGVIGLCLIATSSNISIIIWGRIIVGISITFIGNSSVVYISEISKPNVRGSFLFLTEFCSSVGMILIYLKGWVLNWRTIAWLGNAYLIIPITITCFIPESPAWLVSKRKNDQAKKSLIWFNKYNPNCLKLVEEELLAMKNEQHQQKLENKFHWNAQLKLFFLPTFYKPFLILSTILLFQPLTGVNILMFNCVLFFEEIGTEIDPYLASIYIFSVKVVISIVATMLMKIFNRRTLLLVSVGGMGVCICVSGLNTYWIQQGTSNYTWMPLCFLLLYIAFSAIGITSIPFTMAGEVFPLKIRGVAFSLIITVSQLSIFASLQCYFPLSHCLGGSANVQYFFASMCFLAVIFIYLFLPETHKYKLTEVERYFWDHTIYACSKL